ncbi:MAG: hypothetical protein LBQ60_11185 [Bacteroidales bacterium]|nr:hypothetical protein [Bacteroidales bacterium]
MKSNKVIIFFTLAFVSCVQMKSQTQLKKFANERTCHCIDSLTMQKTVIPPVDSIAKCFYRGVSYAINKEYSKKGKLRLSGKKFYVVSRDLLSSLQETLNCDAYQYYVDSTNTVIIFKFDRQRTDLDNKRDKK